MAGLTWKMWLIGCYGVFCCILLLQTWPVDGVRLNVAGDNLHNRRRTLIQGAPAPAPSTLKSSPAPVPTSHPSSPPSGPPASPPSEPPASSPTSLSAPSGPPVTSSSTPPSPPAPPPTATSPPPSSIQTPPSSSPTVSPAVNPPASPPPVSTTPPVDPPAPPPPASTPLPSVPNAPPPAVPVAPPPSVPSAPSPSVTFPPTLSPSPPVNPPASSPPASTPPPSATPAVSPPPAPTSPPASPPVSTPSTQTPPATPPTTSPSPTTTLAPSPSPTSSLSPPVLLPPPSNAPSPATRSPPPTSTPPPSPNAPPPSSPNSPPPASPKSPPPPPNSPSPSSPKSPPSPSPTSPPPSLSPSSPPPSLSPSSPPPSLSPSSPPPSLSPNSPPPSPSPPSPAASPPAVPPSTPPAAPPSSNASPPPPPQLAPPPTNASPPPPPPPSPAVTPPSLPPAVSPPPTSLLAPPPYALAPGPSVEGCCASNMMLQPGSLGTIQCQCVYPITVKIQFTNASKSTSNLEELFQHDLALGLGLIDVQVYVNYFEFGVNSSFSVKAAADGPLNVESDIGPTSSISFSLAEISNINQTLWNGTVTFNSTYFGAYTVISVIPQIDPAAAAPGPVVALSPTQLSPSSSKSSSNAALYGGIGGGIGAVVLCILLALCIWRCVHRKNRSRASEGTNSSKVSALTSHQLVGQPSRWVPADSKSFPRPKQTREFTYEELSEATNGFAPSAFIGEGGFGKVYRGVLKDGTEVAIKKLTTGGHQGDREFLVEVEMLSRLHHRHLVKLLGYFCSREPLVQLLCYELIPNGSVDSWLHGSLGATYGPLDWPTRMKIAIGSARGLQYLHEDSQPCVIHRDFKASNILLQNNFHAKVADFGLARLAPEGQGNYVSTRVMGTFGYVAPEYAMTGHLLVKSDVYSYGVVLLELLSGRKPIDYAREDFENITAWARPLLTDRSRILDLADPRLEGKFPVEDFEKVADLARTCIEPEWRARPTMGEVVASLNQICFTSILEYNTSSDGERATSSEHEIGNLRSVGLRPYGINSTSSSSNSSSIFSIPWPHRRPGPSSMHHSDAGPSSSTPSSGQFMSGLVHDPISRTNILSEDLQEGR